MFRFHGPEDRFADIGTDGNLMRALSRTLESRRALVTCSGTVFCNLTTELNAFEAFASNTARKALINRR